MAADLCSGNIPTLTHTHTVINTAVITAALILERVCVFCSFMLSEMVHACVRVRCVL